jgi:uncharacterized protein YegP (UPF0339 family)
MRFIINSIVYSLNNYVQKENIIIEEDHMEKLYDFIAKLLNVQHNTAVVAFWVAVGVVIMIIIGIILGATFRSKARKKEIEEMVEEEKKENPVAKEPKEEVKPVEEEKVEPVKEEAKPQEEKKPVEEVKEEPKEEPIKEEPVQEEVKEEPVKEEPKVEAKPVEEKKEEVKKVAPVIKETKSSKSRFTGKYLLVEEAGNWRYKLRASNGEVIIVSEPYASEKAVRTGIDTLKRNINSSHCDIVEDKHGLFSFRIMTKQGRCLATSANYSTKASCENATESYKRWATTDIIIVDEDTSGDHTEVEKIDVEIEEDNSGKYVIKEDRGGYIYQLIAANGRVIASSLLYRSVDSCKEAIEKFRVCVYEGSFFVYKDKNDKFQFKLYNKQNRLVIAGEVYDDKSRVISVIEAIKRLAKLAEVEDQVGAEVPVE